MFIEEILLTGESIRRMEAWADKMRRCESKNHEPYEQNIIVPYHPKSKGVLMSCSNCRAFYERPPTTEEIQSY